MSRLVELIVFVFAQFVAIIAILAGSTFVPKLSQTVVGGLQGKPFQASELARLLSCSCGPMLFGIAVSSGIFWLVRSARVLRRCMEEFPDEPWLWREEWRARQIRLSNRAAVGFLAAATLAYLMILLPLGIYLASLKNAGMVYVFLVALALFLLLFIWQQWINRIRNRSVLNLETLPGRINGDFSGLVTIPLSFPEGTTFHVRLRCEETVLSHARSGNTNDAISVLTNSQNGRSRSSSYTSTVYDVTKLVTTEACQVTQGSTSVPVSFAIPGNLPSSGTITKAAGSGSNTAARRHYSWSIRVRLNNESDLREIVFEIPIYELSPRR